MPSPFVSYAQGARIMSKKAACNTDPKTDYVYHLQVTYLDRGITDNWNLARGHQYIQQ